MPKLTSQQITLSCSILEQLEPGFLPLEIFNQIARLVRLPMVDVIPTKFEHDALHIGLVKRDKDDLWWPNMWHLPGTVLRSTDTLDSAQKKSKMEWFPINKLPEPFVDSERNVIERLLTLALLSCTLSE